MLGQSYSTAPRSWLERDAKACVVTCDVAHVLPHGVNKRFLNVSRAQWSVRLAPELAIANWLVGAEQVTFNLFDLPLCGLLIGGRPNLDEVDSEAV
jgi:hypothetical protein